MLLDMIPDSTDLAWRDKFHGRVAEYSTGNGRCRFLVTETFMNKSGISVSAALKFFKTDIGNLLVIHDELELPFGQYAWKTGGGLGGHNGLKSLRDSLGSADFRRLRLGIGRPDHGSVQSWILGRFNPDEEAALPLILDTVLGELTVMLNRGDSVHERTEPVKVYPG